MIPDRPLARLAQIAEDQWGLVTTRQAEQVDVPWSSLVRMVADGRLERVATAVYRIRGAGAPDHLDLRAAWLQQDPGRPAWQRIGDPAVAVVSHTSAAALYGVGDLPTDVYEFTLPVRRQTRRPDVRLHRGVVAASDRLLLHGMPVTRAARMIGDLLADSTDPSAVAHITREVLSQGYDESTAVAGHVAPYASRFRLQPRNGRALLDYLLGLAGVPDTAERLNMVHADAPVR